MSGEKITVEVTQEDIDLGFRGMCNRCPVALAMNRATGAKLGSRESFTVGSIKALCGDGKGGLLQFELPESVRIAINNYDRGGKMVLMSFSVSIPMTPCPESPGDGPRKGESCPTGGAP